MLANTALLRLLVFSLMILIVALLPPLSVRALPARQECTPPYCYEQPTLTPTSAPPAAPPANPPDNSGGWGGYSDGRLNPDMAEYYSVWCANDQVEVWGGSPSPQLRDSIPLRQIIDMITPFTTPSGITVVRSSDIVLLSGSNGNGASSGSKWFNLNECIARNGGEPPPAPPPPPPPPSVNPPLPTTPATDNGADDAASDAALCLPGSQSTADFIRCLNFFAPDTPSANYVYFISWVLATLCSGGMLPLGLVASVPAAHIWRRRRR